MFVPGTALLAAGIALLGGCGRGQGEPGELDGMLPTGKLLLSSLPGNPRSTNSFPSTAAVSPDGRYVAILNSGYGTAESGYCQSIAVLDLKTNQLADYPDSRLALQARQTYFVGLAFSPAGQRLYASIASLTDPNGQQPGATGNGIAVYRFEEGRVTPETFLRIPAANLSARQKSMVDPKILPPNQAVPYPAGLAVVPGAAGDKLLVAENLADEAVLVEANGGAILQRFPLGSGPLVPSAYPYSVVVLRDGKTAFCSLWNASQLAELNLETGKTARRIPLLPPDSPTAPGSHPANMLLSPNERYLYVCLANSDRVAIVDVLRGEAAGFLSTELPEQRLGGTQPQALAQTQDGRRLFVADSSANAVAVFDVPAWRGVLPAGPSAPRGALGFIPAQWYPTALAVAGDSLVVVTGKGAGTGPNHALLDPQESDRVRTPQGRRRHPYIATLLHGSVARLGIRQTERRLAELTREVERSNLLHAPSRHPAPFGGKHNPIRHVIYIIKENRTYDQVFGDLAPGNGDPSLCLYGEDITPNQHALARQFGVLDNFYCSGEVSENGHQWSTAAIASDYNERTWQIHTRGRERTFDYEGEVLNRVPLHEGIPDIDDPGTGYLWTNALRHGITLRDYGEFIVTHWCQAVSAKTGLAGPSKACAQDFIRQGDPLPGNVGQPHGSPSPWPWPIPRIFRNEATKPELEGAFDPDFAGFRLDYPDQLRVDEFLNEFDRFTRARKSGTGRQLPQLIVLRLGNDHTAGAKPGFPTPAAAVADNDLAVGRVVQAVSQSPYWEDTAILILEDDAQDGVDHVDAHRCAALVASKYSPGSAGRPYVDHRFYTTVSMIRAIEDLLALPPMNNNDGHAPSMAALFSGPGSQPPFHADLRNLRNGLIYRMNSRNAPGARESARMDFSHADDADAAALNRILWRDRKGGAPMPKPRHLFERGPAGVKQ